MRTQPMALLFLFCILTGISCQSGRDLAGNYTAADPQSGTKIVSLEIKSDGKGSWKMDREEVPFTWEERGDEIWLHAKSGGVIRGRIGTDRSIHISLPDVGSFRFERTD